MKQLSPSTKKFGIIHSNVEVTESVGEEFIYEHGLSYIVAGCIKVALGHQIKVFGEGEYIFYRKNFLAKVTKQPLPGGRFQSITVILDQDTLFELSRQQNIVELDGPLDGQDAVIKLEPILLLSNYFNTLMPFFNSELPEELLTIKKQEAIMLLMQAKPELRSVLFDFTPPKKIDLEVFMEKNFRFNVGLERWAYLTGRSLASFKRDFEKIFKTSPSRWLQRKRLEEAHLLLKENGKRPSEIYLEMGFETIAHFSYAFKKHFGISPSQVKDQSG